MSETGNLDFNFILRQSKLDLMARFVEIVGLSTPKKTRPNSKKNNAEAVTYNNINKI